jgi:hypothetical protein
VTLKKGLVALARQWMKFIVVTQGFKAIGLMRPNQLPKPKETPQQQTFQDQSQGLDNGAALQSDTSADGAEFEFDAGRNECFFWDDDISGKLIHDRYTFF